jgi:ubiquinone biosynthesis protein
MRTTIRRLLLLLCALRYGARLLWAAAPSHDKVHWIAEAVARLHAAPNARAALHRTLPELGPLASAFAERSPPSPTRPVERCMTSSRRSAAPKRP